MRLIAALLLSTGLVIHQANAGEISIDGARELERRYNSYLPESLAKSGLIKVRPGTADFEVTFDPTPLLQRFDPKTFSISGLEPILSLIRPLEDGTWRFSQSADLDVKGWFRAGTETTHFAYVIDSLHAEGIFDPDLQYTRSAEIAVDSISMRSTLPHQSVDARLGSLTSTMRATPSAPDTIDVRSNTVINGFTETIVDPAKIKVDLSVRSVTADVAFNGLGFRALKDLAFFIIDNQKKDTLPPKEQARLRSLFRSNLPMFDNLLESFLLTDLKLATPTGTYGAESVHYTVDTNGLRDGAKLGFGMTIDKPSLPPGQIPAAFAAALPESVTTRISLKDFNLKSGMTYLADHADFTAATLLTDEQTAQFGLIVLPNGALTIAYEDVSARSAIYDISLSGTTTVSTATPGQAHTELTVTAKDVDKTVSYLQKNAATVPEFGQAAFMLLMVKGFAKQSPDGRDLWTIVIDQNKKVKINGQDLPF